MRIKFGVSLVGLHISMREVFKLANAIWRDAGQELVVTAGTEYAETLNAADDDSGSARMIHSSASLHPFGRAVDLRTRYFTKEEKAEVAIQLQKELGDDYDVVVHSTHIHVEYDPPRKEEPVFMTMAATGRGCPSNGFYLVEYMGPSEVFPGYSRIKKYDGSISVVENKLLFGMSKG